MASADEKVTTTTASTPDQSNARHEPHGDCSGTMSEVRASLEEPSIPQGLCL